jgi:hypothetical protein
VLLVLQALAADGEFGILYINNRLMPEFECDSEGYRDMLVYMLCRGTGHIVEVAPPSSPHHSPTYSIALILKLRTHPSPFTTPAQLFTN